MGALLVNGLRRVPASAWVAVVAAVWCVVAYGLGYAGYVGYDSLFALTWGEELARFEAPSMGGPFSPTPHPLLDLVGVALSPLSDGAAESVVELLSLLSLVLVAVAGFRLGAALFSWVAGAVAAALLITRPEIVELALYSSFDVAFLALVLLAGALAVEGPGRPAAALAVLALAGLLRPEAWLLALAYAVWLWRRDRLTPRLAALVVAAPLLWFLHDLVATGDPIFSFHGTRAVAEGSHRETGLGEALRLVPRYLFELAGPVVALGGVAGWLLAPAGAAQRRVALPAALFGLTVAAFLAYGAAGLTLYARFLLPAAAALALLCAGAVAGFGARDRARLAAAAILALALLVSAPFTAGDIADVRQGSETRARLEASLHDLITDHRPAIARCRSVQVPTRRVVPPLVRQLDRPKETFTRRDAPMPRTLYVGIPETAPRGYALDPLRPDPLPPFARTVPPGARELGANADWRLSASC